MPEFQILDEKRYPLPGVNKDILPYYRWEHRVTIGYMGRKFIAFLDNGVPNASGTMTGVQPTMYIEEITTGNMEVINDPLLHYAIHRYAQNMGFLNVFQPMPKS